MKSFKKQINKGVLELSILKILNEQDQYGYAIIQTIKLKSDGKLIMKDGTLYPILYRLEDGEFIESYWETEVEGRSKPRKYYKITVKGKERFESMLEDYLEISNGVNLLLKS